MHSEDYRHALLRTVAPALHPGWAADYKATVLWHKLPRLSPSKQKTVNCGGCGSVFAHALHLTPFYHACDVSCVISLPGPHLVNSRVD